MAGSVRIWHRLLFASLLIGFVSSFRPCPPLKLARAEPLRRLTFASFLALLCTQLLVIPLAFLKYLWNPAAYSAVIVEAVISVLLLVAVAGLMHSLGRQVCGTTRRIGIATVVLIVLHMALCVTGFLTMWFFPTSRNLVNTAFVIFISLDMSSVAVLFSACICGTLFYARLLRSPELFEPKVAESFQQMEAGHRTSVVSIL
jgi:hypothetical protein